MSLSTGGSFSNNVPIMQPVAQTTENQFQPLSQEDESENDEMKNIWNDADRFWNLCVLWYVGGVSFSLYLILLGFLQVDEFRGILERDGWFFFLGTGSMGFVMLFITIILKGPIFGEHDVRVWNTTYRRAVSKRSKIKFKKGNSTYGVMNRIGMKGKIGKDKETTTGN